MYIKVRDRDRVIIRVRVSGIIRMKVIIMVSIGIMMRVRSKGIF